MAVDDQGRWGAAWIAACGSVQPLHEVIGGALGAVAGLLLPGWIAKKPDGWLLMAGVLVGALLGAAIIPALAGAAAWVSAPRRQIEHRLAVLESAIPDGNGVKGYKDVQVFVIELRGIREALQECLDWGEKVDPWVPWDYRRWADSYRDWRNATETLLRDEHPAQLIRFMAGSRRPFDGASDRDDEEDRHGRRLEEARVFGRNLDAIIESLT